MASPNNSPIKIHHHCLIAPSSESQTSLPLTFFDLIWLRFHPVERIFFYSLPLPHSDPSFFFDKVVPKLKTSLSLTLQQFLPLAGNIVWPSESPNPTLQFNVGDGVSMVVAECDSDFNYMVSNSPREASESCGLVPHLESSVSVSSVFALQITLFPNRGFCIGISAHHAVLDGKSSTKFIKAWASICKSIEESKSPSLAPDLEPFFDRVLIKDSNGLGDKVIDNWKKIISESFFKDEDKDRSLKLLPFLPNLEGLVRATFELTRGDLDKLKKRVLSMWDIVKGDAEPMASSNSKPSTLSTFVLTSAYVTVCIAKAIQETERVKKKFALGFSVDCRARLEPPIPDNYFGNCVVSHVMDTGLMEDFAIEDGVVIVAKNIYGKIQKLEKGALEGVERLYSTYKYLMSEGVKGIGVAGSNRFGVYETDFGFGNPAKVELTSVDRGVTINSDFLTPSL